MTASRGQLLCSRLTQISHRFVRISQPVRKFEIYTEKSEEHGLLRRIITDWKTPSIVFISGVLGCLFYEQFIEEPDDTGTRDPLITRLMMKYIMADPDVDRQKREDHMRQVKEKMDIYQEMKRKPRLGKQPFDIEKIERGKPRIQSFGPDGY